MAHTAEKELRGCNAWGQRGASMCDNAFCRSLSEELRAQLCREVRVETYLKSQRLQDTRWRSGDLVLLLDGLMAVTRPDARSNGAVTTNLLSGGDLVCGLVKPSESVGERVLVCVTDCVAAVFDRRVAKKLQDSSLEFNRVSYENCLRSCSNEREELFREVGVGDAYAAVRYVVRFCVERGIPDLTHEQIAMLTNRSRSTVTEAMHRLLREEPALFDAAGSSR